MAKKAKDAGAVATAPAVPVAAPAAAAAAAAKPVGAALGGLTAKLAALKGTVAATPSKKGPPDVTIEKKVQKVCKTASGKDEVVEVDAIPEYITLLKTKKDAEARLAELGAEIAELAEPERVRVSRQSGELHSSVRVNHRLTYVVPHGYLMIKLDDQTKVGGLQEVFGTKFDEHFKVSNEVKIKAESLDDKMLEALSEACAKCGKSFEETFDVKQVLVPQESLTQARVMKEDVAALFAKARSEGFIEPKKPTLRE